MKRCLWVISLVMLTTVSFSQRTPLPVVLEATLHSHIYRSVMLERDQMTLQALDLDLNHPYFIEHHHRSTVLSPTLRKALAENLSDEQIADLQKLKLWFRSKDWSTWQDLLVDYLDLNNEQKANLVKLKLFFGTKNWSTWQDLLEENLELTEEQKANLAKLNLWFRSKDWSRITLPQMYLFALASSQSTMSTSIDISSTDKLTNDQIEKIRDLHQKIEAVKMELKSAKFNHLPENKQLKLQQEIDSLTEEQKAEILLFFGTKDWSHWWQYAQPLRTKGYPDDRAELQ